MTLCRSSGGVILMSALLEARTGLHADAFADRHLFAPRGIEKRDWFRNQGSIEDPVQTCST